MARTIRPSIIAQRAFSMATGKPKAVKPLVVVPHGQRPVGFGNRLGATYFTIEDLRRMDKARDESARAFLFSSVDQVTR